MDTLSLNTVKVGSGHVETVKVLYYAVIIKLNANRYSSSSCVHVAVINFYNKMASVHYKIK